MEAHKVKTLLISPRWEPRYPQPPLGLIMIAAVLERAGYAVDILDLNAPSRTEEAVQKLIRKAKPDVIGITAMTSTINSAIRIARIVKQANRDIITILGGPHATILAEQTLMDTPNIDLIIRGEGEETILELYEVLEEHRNKLGRVRGITYRNGHKIKENPLRPYISNLDLLPFPAFHLLPMKYYRLHPPFGRESPSLPIITSRGCPYNCIFCSKAVFGSKYRVNSPNYIIDQISYLIEKFKIKELKFYDDTFTLRKKHVLTICKLLRAEQINIPWSCETRVNLVDAEILRAMKKAGCYMIEYGVESGSPKILSSLRKGINLNQIIEAFKLTHKMGIQTVAYFMVGSPGDNDVTIRMTTDLVKKIDADFAQFSITTAFPGTKLYEMTHNENPNLKRWDEFVYDSSITSHKSDLITKTANEKKIEEWRKKLYYSFYLRIGYIWKRIKKIRSIEDLKTNIAGLRMLLEFI